MNKNEPYPNNHVAKRYLWDVLVPALEKHHGNSLGPDEYKMLFEAVDVCKHDMQLFFAPEPSEDNCVICGEIGIGYGNNPAPVKTEGKCCDDCNALFVIPARLHGKYR